MKYDDLPLRVHNCAALDFGADYIDRLDWTIEQVSPEIILRPIFSIEREELTAWDKAQWIRWFKEELETEYEENRERLSSALLLEKDSSYGTYFSTRCHSLLNWWPDEEANDITIATLDDGIPWILDGHHRLVMCLIKNIKQLPIVIGREVLNKI